MKPVKSWPFAALALFASFAATDLAAAPVIKLDERMQGISIGMHVSILEDKTRKLKIDDVASARFNDAFTDSLQEEPGMGYTESAYWARFTLENPLKREVRWLLEFGYPHLDRISFFVPGGKGSFTEKIAGDAFSFDKREAHYRLVVFPRETPPGGRETYFVRIETTSTMSFPLRLWTSREFADHVANEQIMLGIYIGIMLVMFLYNLFVFISVRELAYLFYLLFIAFFTIFQISLNGLAFQYLWPNSIWWANVNHAVLISLTIAWMGLFSRSFLNTAKVVPLLDKIILVLVSCVGVSTLLGFVQYSSSIRLTSFTTLIMIVAILIAGLVSLKQGNRSAIFYLIAWSAFLISGLVLALKYLNLAPSNFFTDWSVQIGSAVLVILLSLGLADVINSMKRKLEVYNTELENLVDERTRDLKNTLDQVQELKTQQDGDYFLTSLLIKPLGGDFSASESVDVKFLVRQKKRFVFRHWDADIGGDLCAAYSIRLRDRNFTVFINGDAMGKSQQGAGGALVMGTVFKAVISRTQLSGQARNKSPEQWLKECFLELQSVFVSFEGTMLLSAFMGLVDDRTGVLYYINAEHPWAVLYRDGKANFIENKLILRKIGVKGLSGSLMIKLFQLLPGDALIIGSDGRDDILIGSSESGTRIINEDENQFLKRVEEGRADLREIEKALFAVGELTDDLSLMRITYLEGAAGPLAAASDDPEARDRLNAARKAFSEQDLSKAIEQLEYALAIKNDDPQTLKKLARAYAAAGILDRATDACEAYVNLNPAETEFLYFAAYTSKRNRDLNRATDFGERCRLRDPENVKNLINLADTYRLLGNTERAEMILENALELQPDNKKAMQLKNLLRSTR